MFAEAEFPKTVKVFYHISAYFYKHILLQSDFKS